MAIRHSNMMALYEDSIRSSMYTALPAKIVSYDPSTQTCVAQPLIVDENDMQMPQIFDVPVIFPSGGGAVMSFPIKAGEKCWLSYSMYPISQWVRSNADAVIKKNLSRSHHISECVALVGVGTRTDNYQPHPDKVMIRNGTSSFVMDEKGHIDIVADVHIKGNLTVTDLVTGKDFHSAGIGVNFNTHKHHYTWTDGAGQGDSDTPK